MLQLSYTSDNCINEDKGKMLNKEESIKSLKRYFKENKTATMNELIPLLKTTNRMSVFRRLKDLDYISSFSAAGKYYSLRNIAQFGTTGSWIFLAIFLELT
jgi:hypothetical protein